LSATAVHGGIVTSLADSVQQFSDQKLLSRMRRRVHEPELRFFLALLMNVPDRSDLLHMVSKRFPERNPAECCAEWLAQLSVDDQSAAGRMKEMAQMLEASGAGAMQFSRLLRKALPEGVGSDQARVIFRRFIDESLAGNSEDLETTGLDSSLSSTLIRLSELPQLSALGRKQGY